MPAVTVTFWRLSRKSVIESKVKQNFLLPADAAGMVERLSQRQYECLSLVSQGFTSKQIGRTLSLSPSTVDNHLNVAVEKLGCSSRAVAAQILEISSQNYDELAFLPLISVSKIDDNHDAVKGRPDPDFREADRQNGLFPPMGGFTNYDGAARRITQIALIAVAATMAFAAITITIAGIVQLFSR